VKLRLPCCNHIQVKHEHEHCKIRFVLVQFSQEFLLLLIIVTLVINSREISYLPCYCSLVKKCCSLLTNFSDGMATHSEDGTGSISRVYTLPSIIVFFATVLQDFDTDFIHHFSSF